MRRHEPAGNPSGTGLGILFLSVVACGIAAEPFKPGTRQGRRRKNALELLRCHLHPAFGRVSQRIEQRIERRRPVLRSTPVVGAAALAAVAPEDPTVETDRRRCGALNRMARYAATGIDGMIFAHRMRGAAIDAPAACTAPAVAERRVVTVAGRGENQLAQQDESSVLRRQAATAGRSTPTPPRRPTAFRATARNPRKPVPQGRGDAAGAARKGRRASV